VNDLGKVSAAILGATMGGLAAAAALVAYLDWGTQGEGQVTHIDPTRADYVDLLLSLVTVLLAAVGIAVTFGALVIGLVAFKTLREIKDDAAEAAQSAVATKINETLTEMARNRELDDVLERVVVRTQGGGPEADEDESR